MSGYMKKRLQQLSKITILVFFTGFFICILFRNTVPAQNAKALERHGVQLGKKKLYSEAIKQFDRATEMYDKSSSRAYHNKGYAYELQGKKKKAIKSYAEAFRRYPERIATGERLGYLYYKTKQYIKAVEIGEKVLKLDPENQQVPRWLPDAYLKKLAEERRLAELKRKKDAELRKKQKSVELKEKLRREKMSQILKASFDVMLKNGYYYSGDDKGFKYFISDRGLLFNMPESINVLFTPFDSWEFKLGAENPWLGALMPPDIIIHQENLEGALQLGGFKLGVGLLFSHYRSAKSFENDMILFDYKTGFIIGVAGDKNKTETSIRFYPRLLPRDGRASHEETLDVDLLEIKYKYNLSYDFSYYSILSFKDFYTFDHNQELSDYWGVYDIGIGFTLGKISRVNAKRDFTFTIELLARLYFEDRNNDKPYKFTNGQGLGGLNPSKWLKGDPFTAYKAASTVISFKVEEQITTFLFLYQKLIFEMVDYREGHHELNLQLGLGTVL